MIQSFRLRLALLCALLTGVVLLLFGAASWWLIRESKIQRLDTELRAYAEREVNRERTPAQWHIEELRMANTLGLRDPNDLVLLLQDASGATLYQSAHWPSAWVPQALPWPGAPEATRTSWPGLALMGSAMAAEPPRPGDGWRPPEGGPPRPPGAGPGGWRPVGPPPDDPWNRPPPHRLGERPRPLQDAPPPPASAQEDRPRPPPAPIATPVPQDVQEPVRAMPAAPALNPAATELPRPAALPLAQPALSAPPPPPRGNGRGNGPALALAQRPVDGAIWHLVLARIDVAQIAIAVNVQAIEAEMRGIRNAFLLSLPLALLLTGLASWVFAQRAMAPIDKLVKATRSVTAGGLEQRIPATGEDREFVVLIDVFNRMLGRLQRSFQQAHRFTADAAHEFKTPLAIVQGQLERAIQQAEDGSAMQSGLTSTLDEVRRLSAISRKLLMLSQADAGHLAILREPVDLSRMLEELLEDTRMLAPQLRVDADIQPGLRLMADANLLRQVMHNLISNAIKYNVPDGWIRIASARRPHGMEVLVSNASTGITPANRSRLFERFFRADQAHSRSVEGVGLGLSVSREIARAHGGDLTLQGESHSVVQFALVLPL